MRRRTVVWALGLACLAAANAAADPVAPASFEAKLRQPITANFFEVDFESAMNFLAESGGVNIILSEKAKEFAKPVTVHLVDIPLARALEHLVRGQGLLYRLDERTVWVATRDELEAEPLETRVFSLRDGPGLFATFEPIAGTRESVALEATGLRQMRTIKDILSEVVPQVGNSSMLLDERTGSLIVTHVPYYLDQIASLLKELDVSPQQVLIEARFLELSVTDTNEWNLDGALSGNVALLKATKPNANGDGGTRGPKLQLSSVGTTLARGTGVNFTDFANQTSNLGLNFTLQGVLSGTQYQSLLHALVTNEKTKTLSAPRVTTLNNQTATIKIVTEYVYASRYEASVTREDLNGDGDFEDVVNGVRETRFVNVPQDFVTKDLGILLNVTPSIGSDQKTITLGLKPEVSELSGSDTFGGEVELPRFSSRNLETSVVVENGQTVMLGGLMQDTTTKTQTRVPVLGSLPVLGKLFRKDNDSVDRSNLLIFVTAQLIDPSGAHLAYRQED